MSAMSVGVHQEGARWNENELTGNHKNGGRTDTTSGTKRWVQSELTEGHKTERTDAHTTWNRVGSRAS